MSGVVYWLTYMHIEILKASFCPHHWEVVCKNWQETNFCNAKLECMKCGARTFTNYKGSRMDKEFFLLTDVDYSCIEL